MSALQGLGQQFVGLQRLLLDQDGILVDDLLVLILTLGRLGLVGLVEG